MTGARGRPVHCRTNFCNCVLKVVKKRGWVLDSEDWDLFWAEKEDIPRLFESFRMGYNQRVNHHRNFYEICRKDNLHHNINKYRKHLEKTVSKAEAAKVSFCPLSFILPSEYSLFLDTFKRTTDPRAVWIMKPACRSQGKGIFLVKQLSQVAGWETGKQAEAYVIQRYILFPLLLGGKKFDLRIYVLCKSYNPLTVYLYRAGFARFTHERYDPTRLDNLTSHLTNVHFQKGSSQYDEERGGKWLLNLLRKFLLARLGEKRTEDLFLAIEELIVKTM